MAEVDIIINGRFMPHEVFDKGIHYPERKIKGFQIGNEGLRINHFRFGDDTILF